MGQTFADHGWPAKKLVLVGAASHGSDTDQRRRRIRGTRPRRGMEPSAVILTTETLLGRACRAQADEDGGLQRRLVG